MPEVNNHRNWAMGDLFKHAHRTFGPWHESLDEVGGRECPYLQTQTLCNPAHPKREAEAEVHGLRKGWRWRCRRAGGRWSTGYTRDRESALEAAEDRLMSWGYLSPEHMYDRMDRVKR